MRRGFTFLEVMVVVVILGILAAIVVPRFGNASDQARVSAAQASLGSVRAAIAGFRAQRVLEGGSAFPTLSELTTAGTVMQADLPVNPWNGSSSVQSVSSGQAASRAVVNPAQYGWNYFVDNSATPPTCIFYINSSQDTELSDPTGGYKTVNEL
jgi:prepilin-type N-terminal cleavage/methylation domain-containing protein